MKDTRIAALLRAAPQWSPMKGQILEVLKTTPSTRKELAAHIGKPINSITAPVKSLLDAEVIEEFELAEHDTGCKAWRLRIKEKACPE